MDCVHALKLVDLAAKSGVDAIKFKLTHQKQ